MPSFIDLTVSSDDIEGACIPDTPPNHSTPDEPINKSVTHPSSTPGMTTQPRSKGDTAPVRIRRNTGLLPKHVTPITVEDEDGPIQGDNTLTLPISGSSQRKDKKDRKGKQQEPLFFFDFGDAASPQTPAQGSLPHSSENASAPIALDTNDLILPNHVYIDKGGGDASLPPSTDKFLHFLDSDKTKRYFGKTKEEMACGICGGSGHKPNKCPVEVCLTCGEKDEHKTKDCPIALTCWNCGSRGHRSAGCPEPRSGRTCSRCGSHQHVQNSCPTIWRVYSYLSTEQREEDLVKQAKKSRLDFTNGGEGFIAWDRMCFECGYSGHWGFDCQHSSTGNVRRLEPHAFSAHMADAGPFGDGYPGRRSSRRTSDAITSLREATERLRHEEKRRDRASTMFVDGYGFVEAQVGRRAKRRNMERARDIEREREQEDDEDDWFSRRARPGTSSKHGSQSHSHSSTRKKKKSTSTRTEASGLRRTANSGIWMDAGSSPKLPLRPRW